MQARDILADGSQHRRKPPERVVEVHAQAFPLGELPRDIRLFGDGGIHPAGFPKPFHRETRHRPRMQWHHLSLTPDARLFLLEQEDIRRHAAEGVSDELL